MEYGFELSDCVTNAENALKKIKGKGKIVWVKDLNHAYVLPDGSQTDDNLINPEVKVTVGGKTGKVKFEDYTRGQIEDMLRRGEAEDITTPGTKK